MRLLVAVNLVIASAILFAGMWWLSSWDARVTGERPHRDLIRRAIRCTVSLVLGWIFFVSSTVGYGTIPLIMTIPPSLGLLWCGPLSELVSHWLRKSLDGSSAQPIDPNAWHQEMETVAGLIRAGKREEAIKLAQKLQASGQGNPLVLETLLERAGIPFNHANEPAPLRQARRLHAEGKFAEAEAVLKSILAKNPGHLDASMLLMRQYSQLRQAHKAMEVLQALRKQPHVPAAAIDYAQRSLAEWSRPKLEKPPVKLPESVDELLVGGYLGTAIQMLEDQAAGRPDDFAMQLKLAEAYGLYSRDMPRAKKIVSAMEKDGRFSEEQVRSAKDKLTAWANAPAPRK